MSETAKPTPGPTITCGTCRHWGTRGERPESGEYRECQGIPFDDNHEYLYPSPESAERPLALTVDGSGYFAALKSRADFGCVLWEAQTP